MLARIAAPGAVREGHISDTVEQVAMVDDPVADDVDHLALLLHPPLQTDHRSRHHSAALGLEAVGPEDAVGDAGLVLDGDEEDALGAARLLADEDDPGHLAEELGDLLIQVAMHAQIAEEAGEGARLRMRLGGKSGIVSGEPVDLDVTVKKIARNVFQPYGPGMSPLGMAE